MIKLCAICGQPFDAKNPRYKYCDRPHYKTCIVCGRQFEVNKNKINVQTCSTECANASKHMHEPVECTCKICGKKFISKYGQSKDCGADHIAKCEICGQPFHISLRQFTDGVTTCSKKCTYQKSLNTHKRRTGHGLGLSDPNIKAQVNGAVFAKYGVDNVMKSHFIQAKAKNTSLERYGKSSFTQTDEYRRKTIATNNRKYGKDWHAQTDSGKLQRRNTYLEKYGVDNPGKLQQCLATNMNDSKYVENLIQFHNDPTSFILKTFNSYPTLHQLSKVLGIRESSVGEIIHKCNISDMITYSYSIMEEDIQEFLRSLGINNIECNTFQHITPYELDLYLPEYNLAFECNPTYTHNSSIGIFDDSPKLPNYHKMKTDMCIKQGIHLFHIFGYEWEHKQDIIKSMIANLVHRTPNKIYGRKCTIREVSANDAYAFLMKNHRQGGVHSKVRLGLYYNNELVSLMTFGHLRKTLGYVNDATQDMYELVRFCNKLNTSVVGGASKLFDHFVNTYKPKYIKSYSDRAHTTGNLYSVLGFRYVHTNDPGYMWVNLKTDIGYSRNNAQKQNIEKFLGKHLDLTKSEKELMIENGYVQVFDSGTILWEWGDK